MQGSSRQAVASGLVTRIVAGRWGGRRLAAPTGSRTRPTSDRVREALFNTLESLIDLNSARFADLYAGSGAVGLEAASRGAGQVLLVESHPAAAKVARANVEALPAGQTVRVVNRPVEAVLARGPQADPYQVVFADPPYAFSGDQVADLQRSLLAHGWLTPDALVILERSRHGPPVAWVEQITEVEARRYGETILWYGRRS